jgi:K+-transporting ATPase KdpF subunit
VSGDNAIGLVVSALLLSYLLFALLFPERF